MIAPASLGNGGRLGAARLALSVCQAARDDAWQSPAQALNQAAPIPPLNCWPAPEPEAPCH